jgi:hypothetical protein
MSGIGKADQNPTTLYARRDALRVKCGLDAFAQPPEVWLSIAVAAEARGEKEYASDAEAAMILSNERWGVVTP